MRIMKEYLLHITMVLLFLSPWHVEAKGLFIKMTFGLASGGDVDDSLLTSPEFSDYVTAGRKDRSPIGQAVFIELIYQVNSYIGISVSNGYFYKMLKGKPAQYSPAAMESAFIGGFSLSPEFHSEAIPVCLSAILTLPFSSTIRMNFLGGLGYYYGRFESRTKWRLPSHPGFETFEYRSWNFKGDDHAIGFHLGSGLDLKVNEKMFLVCDVLYRSVSFHNIKTSGEIGQDTTFFYLQFYEGQEVLTDFDYRVNQASLSGISVQIGMKFKF